MCLTEPENRFSAPGRRSCYEKTMADKRTTLQPIDHAGFFATLDTPPAPTDRLRAAFARHRETITSR